MMELLLSFPRMAVVDMADIRGGLPMVVVEVRDIPVDLIPTSWDLRERDMVTTMISRVSFDMVESLNDSLGGTRRSSVSFQTLQTLSLAP